LAAVTGALLRWPLLAVLALRRNGRLASHPVLFAKTSHLFLDEYLGRRIPVLADIADIEVIFVEEPDPDVTPCRAAAKQRWRG
jgi:hypothetical protein